jgi:hypothetical protein
MVEMRKVQWIATKHVLRYLRGTMEYGLRYLRGDEVMHGYTYLDWEGSVVDKNSMLGCCFSLGSIMITRFSKNHTFLALG